MDKNKNYYSILGVARDAEEIVEIVGTVGIVEYSGTANVVEGVYALALITVGFTYDNGYENELKPTIEVILYIISH